MNRNIILSVSAFLISILPAFSQTTLTSERILSVESIYRQNTWLMANNPAGLSLNTFSSFSVVETGYQYTQGKFRNVTEAKATGIADLHAESFLTLGNASFYGQIGYNHQNRKDVNRNGNIAPEQSLVQVFDTVAGNQQTECYFLAGAVSLPFGKHWIAAIETKYKVQTNAKKTNPRNINNEMELKLTPGVIVSKGIWKAGASLHYERITEAIEYKNYGNTSAYPFFTRYPLWFYQRHETTGNNYMRMYAQQHVGGAVQFDIDLQNKRLFQEFTFKKNVQTVDGNQVVNKKEAETEGQQWNYQAKAEWFYNNTRQHILFTAGQSNCIGYDLLQTPGSTSVWEQKGRIHRSGEKNTTYALSYNFHKLRDAWNDIWSVTSGITFNKTSPYVLIYPAEYTQRLHTLKLHATATRNFLLTDALLDLSLTGCYGTGSGTLLNETVINGQEKPEIQLKQNQELLKQEFGYKSATYTGISLSARYTRMPEKKQYAWYAIASGEYKQAFNGIFDQNSRYGITVSTGLQF